MPNYFKNVYLPIALISVLLITGCSSPKIPAGSSRVRITNATISDSTVNLSNSETSTANSNSCLEYKKRFSEHEAACQKHYGNNDHTKVKECVIRRLMKDGFVSYKQNYCGN